MAIRLMVGLGNPGLEYKTTRHNAGVWWLDNIAQQCSAKFSLVGKFQGLAAKVILSEHEVWLLKPQTYMNLSGQSVKALAHFYKILPEEILAIHDELDLPVGSAKLKFGGGHGGHNGLKNIQALLGTPNFWRLRLGIGHPGDKSQVTDFVLKTPAKNEMENIAIAMEEAMTVLPQIVSGDFEQAMRELHSKDRVDKL